MNNCKKLISPGSARTVLLAGWVGVDPGIAGVSERLLFRPDRGSGGFVPYDSEKKALEFTGCSRAIQVQLQLVIL